jgi:hypothetical protein
MGESNILHGAMIPRKVTFLDGLTGSLYTPNGRESWLHTSEVREQTCP